MKKTLATLLCLSTLLSAGCSAKVPPVTDPIVTTEATEPTKPGAELFTDELKAKLDEVLEHPIHTSILPLDWHGAPMAGSTDVGDASYVMPTAQLTMATSTLGTASHTWQFTAHGNTPMAHKGMLTAGKVLAMTGIRLFEDQELLAKAREEWMAETGGVYECPIPKEVKPRLNE